MLPNEWDPRFYQLPSIKALDSGINRLVSVWHRRAGKDSCALNVTAKKAHERVGNYWHVMPTQTQARKAIWNGIDKQGRRIIDQAFPPEIRKRTLDQDMFIEFKCGSTWQVVGGDNIDSLVGSNPVGLVLSEYSIMSPRTWRFMSPILAENGGWAWFIYTPRGRNHGYTLFKNHENDPKWHCEVLTVDDTGIVSEEVLEQERIDLPHEIFLQEYYCSWDASLQGAVYAHEMKLLRQRGDYGDFPYDAAYPVETYWDLGVRDATSIIFAQNIKGKTRVIDHHEDTGKFMPDYAKVVNGKPYRYSRHIGPHDLEQSQWGAGKPIDLARNHGLNFVTAPKLKLDEGISAVRARFSRLQIDRKASHLVDCLDQYHRKYDEDKKVFLREPVHDWSSHACDALRTGCTVPEDYGTMPAWMADFDRNWQDKTSPKSFDPLGSYR